MRDGGSALVLVKLDPTTRWWRECFSVPARGLVFRNRLAFEGRIWSRKTQSWRESVKCNFPSVLLVMGPLGNFRGWDPGPLMEHVVSEITRA